MNGQLGDVVVVTEVWRDCLWSAVPHRLVHSSGDETVTLAAAQTHGTFASSRGVSGRGHFSRAERKLEALRTGVLNLVEQQLAINTLNFFVVDSWARVNLGWDAHWRFLGWYVNFELPHAQTHDGLATMDLILDAVVSPAGEWTWKDRLDFDRAVEERLLDEALPGTFDMASDSLQAQFQSGTGPFRQPGSTGDHPPTGRLQHYRRSTPLVARRGQGG